MLLLLGFSAAFAAADPVVPSGFSAVNSSELTPEQLQKYMELKQLQKPAQGDQQKLIVVAPGETIKKEPETKPQQVPLPPAEGTSSQLERAFLRHNPTMLDTQKPEELQRSLKQFGYDFFNNSSQLAQAVTRRQRHHGRDEGYAEGYDAAATVGAPAWLTGGPVPTWSGCSSAPA